LVATTAAEMENVVPIERSSLYMLRMKEEMNELTDKLEESMNAIALQRGVVHDVEKILDAIQQEMKIAADSDEPEMLSALVHDQPQVVEIEELKTRVSIFSCVNPFIIINASPTFIVSSS